DREGGLGFLCAGARPATAEVVSFIQACRERWGVEPICKALQFAPATYYAAISCQASARQQRDDELKVEIARVHRDNFSVYGIEKVWLQLNREGFQVGRARVHRLMGRDGPRGRGPWQTEAHHHHLQRGGPATG